jgi:hypothetical protein
MCRNNELLKKGGHNERGIRTGKGVMKNTVKKQFIV